MCAHCITCAENRECFLCLKYCESYNYKTHKCESCAEVHHAIITEQRLNNCYDPDSALLDMYESAEEWVEEDAKTLQHDTFDMRGVFIDNDGDNGVMDRLSQHLGLLHSRYETQLWWIKARVPARDYH